MHKNNKADSKPFYKNTDSEIIVDKKEHSENWDNVWIIAHDPNNKTGKLKLLVNNKNTWNLIKVNKEYFASYQKKVIMRR